MKKIKLIPVLIAVVFALAGTFAFTSQKAEQKRDPVIYHYTSSSDDIDDMRNLANWDIVETPTGCGSTGDLPCSKTFPEEDDVAFQNYLNGFSTAEALAAAVTTRKD